MTHTPGAAEQALEQARVGLARATARIVLATWLPALVVATFLVTDRAAFRTLFVGIDLLLIIACLTMWRATPSRVWVHACFFAAVIFTGIAAASIENGPQPMSTAAAIVWVAWVTLFFGWRGLVGAVGALAVVYAVAAWRFLHGAVPSTIVDLPSLGYWARLISFVLGSCILAGLIVRAAAHMYEQALARERDAVRGAAETEAARAKAELLAEILQRRQLAGALAAGLAHDLNNAIQVTSAHASLLRDSMRTAAERASLDAIAIAAEKARRLVRDLMGLGRAVGHTHGGFDANEALERLQLMLRGTLPRTVQGTFVADGQYVLDGDELRFQQVIINLVMNAVDAMPNGGTIDVSISAHDASFCAVAVRDSGVGMSADVQAHIFEPFFTTKPQAQGSGIGLAMVARIVAEMRGRIECMSREGEGTTFTVSWPRRAAALPASA